jgi:hypothetical protein
MAKVRVRKLWLNVRYQAPPRYSHNDIIEELIRSVRRGHRSGDYSLPRGWRAVLEWRNKPNVEMRRGPWAKELSESAESSEGFDFAVIKYLEGQYEN